MLSMTKVFGQFSLKCLLNFFLGFCRQNPAKPSFMYQHWTLKVPTTDSLAFLSEHIWRPAILTQASVITCE